jgi:kynureninase
MSEMKLMDNMDNQISWSQLRSEFVLPPDRNQKPQHYFAGHSLGLMPRKSKDAVDEAFETWSQYGVEGHFKGNHPFLPYHEFLTPSLARLVGAKEAEVVAMNSLTVNLHLMMVSFYRPTKSRFKILIENNTFPSDQYAVQSQARFHGFDPKEAVVELPGNGFAVEPGLILETIDKHKDELALILIGDCNYLSGQHFDIAEIVKLAHRYEIPVGINLAHGAGNLELKLHDWNVDFAVWCSYKYLNSGPGGIAGTFVHERHLKNSTLPRFQGWWGHNKSTRFKMGPNFDPIPTVEAWQLSNPPIFQLASLRASLEIFDSVGMKNLRKRGDVLTSLLESSLLSRFSDQLEVLTPPLPARGSMLSVRLKKPDSQFAQKLYERSCVVDYREPGIIRMAPCPLYTNEEDINSLISALEEVLK